MKRAVWILSVLLLMGLASWLSEGLAVRAQDTGSATPTPIPTTVPTAEPIVGNTTSGLANSPWPMFGHDPQHTGRSEYTGPDSPQLKWTYRLYSGVHSPLAVGEDGTVYVCSGGKLYAINTFGVLKWKRDVGCAYITPGPAIGKDGTIYFPSACGSGLLAIDPSGSVKWSRKLMTNINASLVIADDGTIYASGLGYCYAINPDGSLRWEYKGLRGWAPSSPPAIGDDGTIYISNGPVLNALNYDASLRWTYEADSEISPPCIGGDGTIYIGSHLGLYAVDPEGTLKWKYLPTTSGGGSLPAPAIGNDSTIYYAYNAAYSGSPNAYVYAIDPNGSLKWVSTNLRGFESVLNPNLNMASSLIIGGDGTLYAAAVSLYALNPDGSVKWNYGENCDALALGSDGTIYSADLTGGEIHAIGPSQSLVQQANSATSFASALIVQEKSKGYRLAGAENVLNQGKQYFELGDYQKAYESSLQSMSLAMDIDQDGVPNELDFAPNIKNIYIYAGAPASVFVVFVLALSILIVRFRRRRLANQRIEEQKAEIIGMIDEALNNKERK